MHKPIKTAPYVYPLPVAILLTYNADGTPNAMTAAWAVPVDSDILAVCLSPEHKTNANFHRDPHVTVSFATKSTMAEAAYFGTCSGNDVPNKVAATSLHDLKLAASPVMEEFPVAILCLFDHEDESTGMNYFKIEKVLADEKTLDENGRVDLVEAEAIVYDSFHRAYREVGKELGDAYSMGEKFVNE